MKASSKQREQIDDFFSLVRDYYDDLLLYPMVDQKTGTERLALCVGDRQEGLIYVLGMLFEKDDPLYERFHLKEMNKKLNPKGVGLCERIKKAISLLWV